MTKEEFRFRRLVWTIVVLGTLLFWTAVSKLFL